MLPQLSDMNSFDLKHLLVHEYIHKWINNDLIKKDKTISYKWFTEGFTKYFSDKINFDLGIITLEEYVRNYNSILRHYYSSVYSHYDTKTLSELYWQNTNANSAIYNRGYIIAQELETLLAGHTDPKSNLFEIINKILTEIEKNDNSVFNNSILEKHFNNATNSKYQSEIKFILQGTKLRHSKKLQDKVVLCQHTTNFFINGANGKSTSIPQYCILSK